MRYVGHLVAVAVIFFIISLGACSAQTAEQHNGAVDWLSRYGYMPPLDLQRGALQTHEGIERALRQMQRFAGIEETGRLDNATLTLMKSRRCSLPDSPASEDLWRRKRRRRRAAVGLRWNKADVTWSVHSYPSPDRSPSLHQQTGLVELILTYALKAWSDAIPLDFVPLQGGGGAEGDIRVEFTSSYHDDGYPFDGAGGTLAHAFYPGTALMAGDTHFDDGESWSYGYGDEQGTSDLFTVAVHEFGHALGLSHSSSDVSIMKPYYQGSVGDIPSYTLPTDDRWAIQAVYGRRAKSHRPPTVAPTDPSLPNIPSPPPPRNTPHPDPTLPDRCTGRYDAVANIRGEVFFFKGAFFWRVQRSSLMSRKPALIHNFWLGLPAGLTAVDAVYERTDGHIVFFIGDQYWMFKDRVALPGYPRPLDDWGMSTTRGQPPPRVEAAFVWTHNHKTYLFSEGQFWRFDESGRDRRLEAGYPRTASLWTGVPSEPDDIISWGDGNSYFFKDMSYWILKRGELDLNNLTPKSVAVDWMQCEIPEPRPTLLTKVPEHRGQACHCDTSTAQTLQAAHWLVMLSVCFFNSVVQFNLLGVLKVIYVKW